MTMITLSSLARRVAAGLLLALGCAACGGPPPASAPAAAQGAAAPAAGPITIDIAKVVEQPLDVPLSLPGELVPYQSVALFSRVNGFVKTIAADRGSRVSAGDVLATIEAPELVAQRAEGQAKLQAAESQLASAGAKAAADRSTFDKLKAASATPGVVAGNDLLIAEKAAEASANQAAAARQQVEAARQAAAAVAELEGYLRITAPFAGVVTERNVHPGALVGPATGAAVPMLRVVDERRLRLVVPVPEAYTASVSRGAALTFTVAAYPGKPWTGTVARIARAVDVATRTMAVELDVANADGALAPGAFCQVRWPVHRTAPSLFVPSASVATTTDRTFVIRVTGGKAEWVTVRTGLTAGPLVEVFGDLKPGDEIAGRGTDEIRAGMDVRARPPA